MEYLELLRQAEDFRNTEVDNLQNLQNHPQEGFVGFEGSRPSTSERTDCRDVIPAKGLAEAVASLADPTEPAYRWLLHFPDSEALEVCFWPVVTHADALAAFPKAAAAEPLPWPEPADVPADLVALFDECLRAGLYDETERALLPGMVAADLAGTRALLADVHGRIRRCTRCRHFRRPGLSGGYCTGRADLPLAYGLLHSLPADGGAWCRSFGEA